MSTTTDTLQGRADTLVVPPLYAGSVAAYIVMSRYGRVVIDATARYDKRRKELHRTTISGPNGDQRLTVPLCKPQEWHSTRIADIRVSDHGDWWHVHWGALESAYGRTPYFEFYADDLKPWFTGEVGSLVDLDMGIHRFALEALGIDPATHRLVTDPEELAAVLGNSGSQSNLDSQDSSGSHERLGGGHDRLSQIAVDVPPYYQIWAQRFGFNPSLSILDLIFNLGPEATLYLDRANL